MTTHDHDPASHELPPGADASLQFGFRLQAALLAGAGALCALSLPVLLDVNKTLAPQLGLAPDDIRGILDRLAIGAATAVWFLTLALGVFRVRRWACDLALITGFLWLAMGVLSTLVFVERLPQFTDDVISAMGNAGIENEGAVAFTGFLSQIAASVLLPATIVWFFSGARVRAHLERHEPPLFPAPLPVVALGLFLLFVAIQLPPALAFHGALPVFDRIVTGLPGMTLVAVLTLGLVYAGVGLVFLKMRAWFASVLLLGLMAFSASVSASRIPPEDFAGAMGIKWPVGADGKSVFENSLHSRWTAAGLVAALAFAFFARRFFPPRDVDTPGPS